MTAWNYHQDVAESWDELESNRLGTKVNVEGKMYLEKSFVVRHREGLVKPNTVSLMLIDYIDVCIRLIHWL